MANKHREVGSATAELVILLPLLSVVIWVAGLIGNSQVVMVKNLVAAASLVRAVQLGQSRESMNAVAQSLGVSFQLKDQGQGIVCVSAKAVSRPAITQSLIGAGEICGLTPDGEQAQ